MSQIFTRFFVSALTAGALMSTAAQAQAPKARAVAQAPVPPATEIFRFDYKAGEISKLCTQSIRRYGRWLKEAAKSPSTLQTLLAFENATADFGDETNALTFQKYVSTDEKLRAEGAKCEEKVSDYLVGVFTRRDLYKVLSGIASNPNLVGDLRAPEARLLSETLKGFEMNGLKLPDAQLNKVRKLMKKLAQLENRFGENINKDESSLTFTAKELEGMPEAALARLTKKPDGSYVVTTKTPDYVPVMENAKDGEVRRKLMLAYQNRAMPANLKLLSEILELRRQIATQMGFATWADYKTSNGRMAKSGKEALDFLNGLRGKLAERSKQDLKAMEDMKKQTEPNSQGFQAWDFAYYGYQLKKAKFELDNEEIREYFPADIVVAGMFEVYSKLLGVRFVEEKGAPTWAEGVKLYDIVDTKSGETVAYFFADFFPRKGKYSHAAAFSLVSGRSEPDGKYSKPVSSIVANFTAPSDGKPSLLDHDEVETIFHEFGHIMHQTLTRAPYASISGTSVARDFVEAPSQMLENWVWSPEILQSLSGHYKDTKNKLPSSLLKKMIAARDFNQGIFYTKQLYYGLMDMTYHTAKEAFDTTKVQEQLHREIVGIEPIPGGHWEASFGHLMGYDAGYYGYLWSEVFAQDMFTRFEKGGLLSPEVGGDYRRIILESGNLEDAIVLLRKFLGREPNNAAFFKKLHIK